MSFSLTRKTDYALVALARLAQEGEKAGGKPLSARQIAEESNLPVSLLMNVLKELHKADIVGSHRGQTGGYTLADSGPAGVTMLQIVEALEGPVRVAVCCDEEAERVAGREPCVGCRAVEQCPNVDAMQRFNDRVREFLGGITLRELIAKPRVARAKLTEVLS